MGKIIAVCLDCGDTLADEGTEVKNTVGATLQAELIPGADATVRELRRRGYPLALVADGPVATFQNILTQHDLIHEFDAFAISEELGVEKPEPRMFHHAMEQLGIGLDEYASVLMVGNNLERDVRGANQVGMISVWLDWAPRRAKIPADASEVPDYTIKLPYDLIALIERLEAGAQ